MTLAQIEHEIAQAEFELQRRSAPDRLLASLPQNVRPLLAPKRYKGLFGGRGGTKSQTLARLMLLYAMWHEKKWGVGFRGLCGREIQNSLKESVKKLLEDIIKEYALTDRFDIRASEIGTPGGGVLLFQGLQSHTVDSVKSLEGIDVAWIEEAQSISEKSLTLLRPTIRKEYPDGTTSEIWASWNPELPSDPIEALLRRTPRQDAIVIECNYTDNPYFPNVLRQEMEADRLSDPDKYEHVWKGGYQRKSEARVFKNYEIRTFETPDDAAFLFGADWGFSVDPSVLVRGWIEWDAATKKGTLYIDREAYKVGCEIDDTPALFDGLDPERIGIARAWPIIADSARPETISYLKNHGYPRMKAARKGANSVQEGIEFLRTLRIVVHTRCTHAADEFATYCYKKHPLTGEIIPVLEDKKNHVIDSLRYMVEDIHAPEEWLNW